MAESIESIVNGADPTWKSLYKIGGICAFLYVIFALAVPFFMFISNTELSYMVNGADILELINSNGTAWWVALQTMVLGTSFLAIITFAAVFVALKHLDKAIALAGALIAIVIHILFIAYYPVMLGLSQLAKNYQGAAEAQQLSFASAAEALLAINNAFNPLYETVFAVSILVISLVMLKGIFDKKIAWLGILTSLAAFIALLLWPLLGIGYLWWWLFFMLWFIAVGWKLYKLGAT
jgi:hypothetical protein